MVRLRPSTAKLITRSLVYSTIQVIRNKYRLNGIGTTYTVPVVLYGSGAGYRRRHVTNDHS